MLKPPTGEPCAGEPHARFGGRGGATLPDPYHIEIIPGRQRLSKPVISTKKGPALEAGPRSFLSALVKNKRLLTAALTDITAAWVDHPATTGIDHIKTAAIIGNPAFTAFFFIFAVRFADARFIIGHVATSFGGVTIFTRGQTLIADNSTSLSLSGKDRLSFPT